MADAEYIPEGYSREEWVGQLHCAWATDFSEDRPTLETFLASRGFGEADYAIATAPSEPRPPTKTRLDGFVYFIGSLDGAGCIKVGWAKDPRRRLKALQTGSPVKLYVMAAMPADYPAEREMHERFRGHRSHGEWFELHPEILAEIARLNAGAAP